MERIYFCFRKCRRLSLVPPLFSRFVIKMSILCIISYPIYLLLEGITNGLISFAFSVVMFSFVLVLVYTMTVTIFDLWENAPQIPQNFNPRIVFMEGVIVRQTLQQVTEQDEKTPAMYPFTVEVPNDAPVTDRSSKRISQINDAAAAGISTKSSTSFKTAVETTIIDEPTTSREAAYKTLAEEEA